MPEQTEQELTDAEVTKAVVRRIPRLAKILIALLLSGGTATAGVVLSQGDSGTPAAAIDPEKQDQVDTEQWRAIRALGDAVNTVATRTSVIEQRVGTVEQSTSRVNEKLDTLLRGVSDLQGQLRVLLRRDQP